MRQVSEGRWKVRFAGSNRRLWRAFYAAMIRVLEAGEIPSRKVGRHRRVLMKDVLLHKQANLVKRRAALDELVRTSEEVGGYDL